MHLSIEETKSRYIYTNQPICCIGPSGRYLCIANSRSLPFYLSRPVVSDRTNTNPGSKNDRGFDFSCQYKRVVNYVYISRH